MVMVLFAVIGRSQWCGTKNLMGRFNTPIGAFGASVSPWAMLFEDKRRWAEYALNVFPRYLESIPVFIGKQGLWPVPRHSQVMNYLLMSISIGSISHVFFTDAKSVKRSLRWLVVRIMGPLEGDEIKEEPEEVKRKLDPKLYINNPKMRA